MIKHIVMWKLKDHAEAANKQENAQKLKKRLEGLKVHIPELLKVEAGINFNDSEAAFDVVLYSEFESRDALTRYQKHAEHQKLISEFLDKVRTEKHVVDYEV